MAHGCLLESGGTQMIAVVGQFGEFAVFVVQKLLEVCAVKVPQRFGPPELDSPRPQIFSVSICLKSSTLCKRTKFGAFKMEGVLAPLSNTSENRLM